MRSQLGVRKDYALMIGLNKTDFKQGRRVYLFLLLTAVIFLTSLFVFPNRVSREQQTTVTVKLNRVDHPQAAKSLVVSAIKRELSVDRLTATLEEISASTTLQSSILGHAEIEKVRNSLMSGALQVDSIGDREGETNTETESGSLGFSISFKGTGSEDEIIFVQTLARNIRKSLEPDSLKEIALAQLGQVQSKIRESNSLSSESQKAIESSVQKFLEQQRRLFTSTKTASANENFKPSNWELKNLAQQRQLAFKEYQANEELQFREKQAVQSSLLRRIEYLDQEIDRLKKKSSGERMAGDDNGVKKASYIDTGSHASDEPVSSDVQNLKADLALAVNKIVLAQNRQKQTLRSARELSEMLQQNRMHVQVSDTKLTYVDKTGNGRLWILLAASGLLGGFVVMRIDARAFATILRDERSVETALQMPVIGQVNLPESSDAKEKSLGQMNQWVQRLIKFCEMTLLIAILLFLAVLWINSDFSMAWMNDPTQILKNSFS